MKRFWNWLTNEECGQGMVEYGLILMLIALVVVGSLAALGLRVNTMYGQVRTSAGS